MLWNTVVKEIGTGEHGVGSVTLQDTRTDEKCETHIPGIFSAGDLRERYARQIVLAAGDGALAAARFVEDRKVRKADEACELPAEMLNN